MRQAVGTYIGHGGITCVLQTQVSLLFFTFLPPYFENTGEKVSGSQRTPKKGGRKVKKPFPGISKIRIKKGKEQFMVTGRVHMS